MHSLHSLHSPALPPKNISKMKQKLKLILLLLSIVLALFALWQVENVAQQVRQSEESKIRLWANAIAQRNRMTSVTHQFFQEATLDEQRKIRLYTDILESFNDPDQSTAPKHPSSLPATTPSSPSPANSPDRSSKAPCSRNTPPTHPSTTASGACL